MPLTVLSKMSEPDPVTTMAHDPAAPGPGTPPPRAEPEQSSDRTSEASDPRCGYPKKDGSPCRNKVPEAGKVCRVHQKAALLDRILAGRQSAGDPGST